LKVNWRKVEFLKSAFRKEDFLNAPYPVFTFCGRSNVGKSSLINMLTLNRKMARTSATPGKTISVNYFLVDGKILLADLPGYGYAKRSKKEKERWKRLMEDFFVEQKGIKENFILVDSRIGLTELDLIMVDWLKFLKQEFAFILTKTDKIKISRARELAREIESQFGKSVILTSAKKREGRRELINHIEKKVRGEKC